MIRIGDYLRCTAQSSVYYGCVFKVVGTRTMIGCTLYYVEDAAVGYNPERAYNDGSIEIGPRDEPVLISKDDPLFPADILDQPIYKVAKKFFNVGDYVKVSPPGVKPFIGRVYDNDLGWTDHMPALISMICLTKGERFSKPLRYRYDYVELIDQAHPNELRDYVTNEVLTDNFEELYLMDAKIGYVSRDRLNDSNLFRCVECGHISLFNRTYAYETDEGFMCAVCFRHLYDTCCYCGRYCRISTGVTDEDGSFWCPTCAEEHDIRCDNFHDYWYKPSPIFHRTTSGIDSDTRDGTLFMGVELEIDRGSSRTECVDALSQENGWRSLMYFKHDSSLGSEGIEIVTHPCTLDYHCTKFPWQDVIDIAHSFNYKSHDTSTCGLHVHVNRTALGDTVEKQDETASRIVFIFDKFWEKMARFSRRKQDRLDHYAFAPLAGIDGRDSTYLAVGKSKNACCEHYCAVNLSNQETVEFRIFRGTLKYNTLIASLELISNVVEFAKLHTLDEIDKSEWEDLINIHKYDELARYLQERGMTATETTEE